MSCVAHHGQTTGIALVPPGVLDSSPEISYQKNSFLRLLYKRQKLFLFVFLQGATPWPEPVC